MQRGDLHDAPGRFVLAAALSALAGTCIALQSRANGELSQLTGQPIEASVISMTSGFLALCLAGLVSTNRAALRRGVQAIRPGFDGPVRIRWWYLGSGALGALLLLAQAWAVPIIGVAIFTVAFVAGQTGNALVVDRFGLGPGAPRPIAPGRVVAAALAVLGVGVTVSGQGSGALAVLPLLASLLVGGTNILQQAFNGMVSLSARSVFVGTFLNFGVGTIVLVLLTLASAVAGYPPLSVSGAPWWAFTGGLLGIVFIAVGAWAIRHVGILIFAVTSLLGNLGMAVVLDLFSPTHSGDFGLPRLLGVLVTFVAAASAAWFGRPPRRARTR